MSIISANSIIDYKNSLVDKDISTKDFLENVKILIKNSKTKKPKSTRLPTPYNIHMKFTMKKLKEEEGDESDLNKKDANKNRFALAASMWHGNEKDENKKEKNENKKEKDENKKEKDEKNEDKKTNKKTDKKTKEKINEVEINEETKVEINEEINEEINKVEINEEEINKIEINEEEIKNKTEKKSSKKKTK
jgi:hypothetical protein